MSSDDPVISVRGVTKHYLLFAKPEDRLKQSILPRLQRLVRQPPRRYYRDFKALQGITFDVRRGETVGIIGRNGSGKSTLLEIVCGILQPSSGSVSVNGRIAALLELGSGFNGEFTGRENVYMNGAILGLRHAEMAKRFDAIAGFADIGAFIDQPVRSYSKGMRVRLAFATAINVDPDILVVDEALAVGDEAFRRKCYARIEEIQNSGSTILFVSHSGQTIVQLCSRAVLLDRGQLLLDGPPKTVVGQYQRLVHASPDNAPHIRKEIQSMRCAVAEPARDPAAEDKMASVSKSQAAIESESESVVTTVCSEELVGNFTAEEFFAPELKPESTVYHEERGARIRDPRILTLDGRQVNILKLGHRYALEYYVDFKRHAVDVGYGMMISATDGKRVAGATTRRMPSLRLAQVDAGQTGLVRIEFFCRMLPGAYFVNCVIAGVIDGEPIRLHAIRDALMLHVLPEKDRMSAGMVDISPSMTALLEPSGLVEQHSLQGED
jgi:homopolymeric O-antigen transport system ATP-binding protein